MGSHVDVLVVDANGKTIAAVATDYLPRHIPRRIRGSRGTSHYVTRLPSVPPPSSSVRVIFHGTKRSNCAIAHASPL